MSNEKTPAQILRDAAELIRTRGWCQGEYEIDGCLCIFGAVHVALGREPDGIGFTTADRQIADALRSATGVVIVPDWNDAPGRTAEQVIAAIERAAASIEAA